MRESENGREKESGWVEAEMRREGKGAAVLLHTNVTFVLFIPLRCA